MRPGTAPVGLVSESNVRNAPIVVTGAKASPRSEQRGQAIDLPIACRSDRGSKLRATARAAGCRTAACNIVRVTHCAMVQPQIRQMRVAVKNEDDVSSVWS